MITGGSSPGPLPRGTFGQQQSAQACLVPRRGTQEEQQRERVIVSDSEQVGGPLAGPAGDDQADVLGESAAIADGTAGGADGTAGGADAALDADVTQDAEQAEAQ